MMLANFGRLRSVGVSSCRGLVQVVMSKVKIGIVGGTGFEDGDVFEIESTLELDTPFGKPSDKLKCGKMNGVDVVFLSRHSKDHSISPSAINYRANMYALKKMNCTHIITTNACGSLDANYQQGELVVLDQLYDHTKFRVSTFYDGSCEEFPRVHHSPCADPFNEELRQVIIKSFEGTNVKCHPKGAIAVIEGPRFSTRCESRFFKSIGCHLIGMTSAPEAFLAFELGIPYATVALVTDMDSWDETVEHVTAEGVTKVFAKFVDNLKLLLVKIVDGVSQRYP